MNSPHLFISSVLLIMSTSVLVGECLVNHFLKWKIFHTIDQLFLPTQYLFCLRHLILVLQKLLLCNKIFSLEYRFSYSHNVSFPTVSSVTMPHTLSATLGFADLLDIQITFLSDNGLFRDHHCSCKIRTAWQSFWIMDTLSLVCQHWMSCVTSSYVHSVLENSSQFFAVSFLFSSANLILYILLIQLSHHFITMLNLYFKFLQTTQLCIYINVNCKSTLTDKLWTFCI